MRNMSFGLTVPQMQARTKRVTRRVGWRFAKVGMLLQPVRKGMGLRAGETIERITSPIVVQQVTFEPLCRLSDDLDYGHAELALEGFPDHPGGPDAWCEWFIQGHRGCAPDTVVTRIAFDWVA
jgi:hypothetical protein